jgi:hypothetical protein
MDVLKLASINHDTILLPDLVNNENIAETNVFINFAHHDAPKPA